MSIAETVYEKLKSAPPELAQEVLDFLEFLENKGNRRPVLVRRSWDEFMGTLKGSKLFAGDPVDIQRRMRAEWDVE